MTTEPDETKVCGRCGTNKGLAQFHNEPLNRDGRQGKCKSCVSASRQEKRQADPEAWKDADQKRKHGIPLGAYARMLANQDGGCAICGREPGDKRLHIDHDHETGVIRSLLCESCNRGLGFFFDDPEKLSEAIRYLRWWQR